ncbi:MAG: TIGR02217 family protein [Hyphomicrobiaceae bacterium]
MANFHEVRFPTGISRASQGGPERRTDVVVLGSAHEERNARWADSRRSYNAGYGVRSLDDLDEVIVFFEERRGRLYGFRWRDAMDWKSCVPSEQPRPLDQTIGIGDGVTTAFQLVKTYGRDFAPWRRKIRKPVLDSVTVAIDGTIAEPGSQFVVDASTGMVTFIGGYVPAAGAVVTAGYAFDVPVRFDTDRLEVNIQGFRHGAIPSIPVIEVRT